MPEPLKTHLEISDGALSSERYGDDYLSEFRRIILAYVQPATRQYLEWERATPLWRSRRCATS